jgi:predicted GNAT family N-acyltransferase
LFRSKVLFDSGFRKDFDEQGRLFGDVAYADFESHHVVATIGDRLIGTVRVTPPSGENVARSVLGPLLYGNLITKIDGRWDRILEINRLMIDPEFRELKLGRTLMYAAMALIETYFERSEYEIIGSAGNCTKQADFFLKHTDYERIAEMPDHPAPAFNDTISFLRYKQAPYIKGADEIQSFRDLFASRSSVPFKKFAISNMWSVTKGPVESTDPDSGSSQAAS